MTVYLHTIHKLSTRLKPQFYDVFIHYPLYPQNLLLKRLLKSYNI